MPDHEPGCSCCGAPIDPLDLDVRIKLPDALRGNPDMPERTNWQRVDGVGGFVRCLLTVRLTGGGSITFSPWLQVSDSDYSRARSVLSTPDYATLRLNGTVANAIQPWPAILGAAAVAEVRDPAEQPWLVPADDGLFAEVATQEWDRDLVLSTIAAPLPADVRDPFLPDWSITRTAGMQVRVLPEALRFVGQGRTVQIETFSPSTDLSPSEVIARSVDGTNASISDESDAEVARASFEHNAPNHFERVGFAAVPGTLIVVNCMYDDPDDLAWARDVFTSLRYTPSAVNPSTVIT